MNQFALSGHSSLWVADGPCVTEAGGEANESGITNDHTISEHAADDGTVRRIVIPGLRAIVSHSWLDVLTGKIVPLFIFLALFHWTGVTAAVLTALAYSLGLVAYQRANGHRIAGLVILSIVGNTAKTIVAIATGSVVAYFIQPTISTTLIGTAFLISVPLGLPLAERLVRDFLPFNEEADREPALQSFWPRLSLLWAATSLLNGAVTLYLLLTQSITNFLILKAFLGPATTTITIVVGIWWFQRRMHEAGIEVVLARTVRAARSAGARSDVDPAVLGSAPA